MPQSASGVVGRVLCHAAASSSSSPSYTAIGAVRALASPTTTSTTSAGNKGIRSISGSATHAAGTDATVATTDAAGAPGWTLTLERGIGKSYGAEEELQRTEAFRAEVFPDLPIATTWQNLAKAIRGGLTASATAPPSPSFTHYATRTGAQKVITVASNLRSELEIEQRIVKAAGDGAEEAGGQRANALLCVSGSHPVRTLPMVAGLLRSSLDTLRIAQRLKERGYIPPGTQLWVVANPNTERGVATLERKAELGANAVLTQPPLDWPAYLAWLDDAETHGLLLEQLPTPSASTATTPAGQDAPDNSTNSTRGSGSSGGDGGGGGVRGGPVRLIVGHPMASSAANLSFWLSLSSCGGSAAARTLVADALRAEAGGKEAAAAHHGACNRKLVKQILARGGVAGLHVMPIGKASKALALRMLADGSLPPSA